VARETEIHDRLRRNRSLLTSVLGPDGSGEAIDVINTASWNRTDLVVLTREQSAAGDIIVGPTDTVPSQRLASGELAFIAARSALGAAGTLSPGRHLRQAL
jgi:hypothetical protein